MDKYERLFFLKICSKLYKEAGMPYGKSPEGVATWAKQQLQSLEWQQMVMEQVENKLQELRQSNLLRQSGGEISQK